MFVATIASGGSDAVELGEDLALDRRLLEHGLDDDVAAGEIGELGRDAETGGRRVAGVLVELALLDLAREEVLDPPARALSQVGAHLAPDHVEARLDRDLRDTGAHRPEPHDPDLHGRDPRTHMKRVGP